MDDVDGSALRPMADGGIEAELGWALNRISTSYSRWAIGAVSELPGGPRGYQVLVLVTTEPDLFQLALAQRLGINKTAMTDLVDDLEGAGLVTRRPDPADRRVRQVIATEAGRAALKRSRHDLRAVENQILGDLTSAEAIELRALLTRVALTADQAPSCEITPRSDSKTAPLASSSSRSHALVTRR